MGDKVKCAHATCSCVALPFDDYCCDGCRTADEKEEAGDEPMARCKCAHPDCVGEPEVSPDAESLFAASQVLAST